MRRLTTLLLSNNYIVRIHPLGDHLISITTLVLTNNRISSFAEIDAIANFTKLELLSLLDNPIITQQHYRLYVIFKIKSLKSLDFRKVKHSERVQSNTFFATSSEGKAFLENLSNPQHSAKPSSSQNMSTTNGSSNNGISTLSLTEEQRAEVRAAIAVAKTPKEVDEIEEHLKVPTSLTSPLLLPFTECPRIWLLLFADDIYLTLFRLHISYLLSPYLAYIYLILPLTIVLGRNFSICEYALNQHFYTRIILKRCAYHQRYKQR